MIKSVAADGDATAFMTDHFSLYIKVDTEEITCHEVNFYYKDAEGKDGKCSTGASSAGS